MSLCYKRGEISAKQRKKQRAHRVLPHCTTRKEDDSFQLAIIEEVVKEPPKRRDAPCQRKGERCLSLLEWTLSLSFLSALSLSSLQCADLRKGVVIGIGLVAVDVALGDLNLRINCAPYPNL